jgi:hypothetical protein
LAAFRLQYRPNDHTQASDATTDNGLLREHVPRRFGAGLLRVYVPTAPFMRCRTFEGYAIEQALRVVQPDEAYFWATHQGAELDLLLFKGGKRIGIEVKRQDAPALTASMRIALEDLKLDRLVVLYPGDATYAIAERVEAVPLAALAAANPRTLLGRSKRGSRAS